MVRIEKREERGRNTRLRQKWRRRNGKGKIGTGCGHLLSGGQGQIQKRNRISLQGKVCCVAPFYCRVPRGAAAATHCGAEQSARSSYFPLSLFFLWWCQTRSPFCGMAWVPSSTSMAWHTPPSPKFNPTTKTSPSLRLLLSHYHILVAMLQRMEQRRRRRGSVERPPLLYVVE